MWKEAFGDEIDATISPTEQGSYIGLALTGPFQAFGWRNHGGIDPDTQRPVVSGSHPMVGMWCTDGNGNP